MIGKKITQKEFTALVTKIHGNRYGLENAIYVNAKTQVSLHCPIHGDFCITPDKLLYSKQGCPKCAGKGKTTEDFIKECRVVHGDRYDYSKTKYTKSKEKVIITCKIHGDFEMLPRNHVALGCNCPKCSKVADVTKDMFFERAYKKFGNRFDYSLANFINNQTEITIKCNVCGNEFKETPKNHISSLQGGCPMCRYKYVSNGERVVFSEFVNRARGKHGGKYTYCEESYTNFNTPTKITCPIHGDFMQKPCDHVKGCGCKECTREKLKKSLKVNTKIFKERAKNVYGDRFDLTNVDYKGCWEKVSIKCNTCGNTFEQMPPNFLRGMGCPICKMSEGEAKIKYFLEKCNIKFQQQYLFPNEDLFCQNKNLYVDFFLKDFNTVIEFNGNQHYRPINFFGGLNGFERQQRRDDALRLYCNEHKIMLIEIPYKDINRIETILIEKLNIKNVK